MIDCARCSQAKNLHNAAAPHTAIQDAPSSCIGWVSPFGLCGRCGEECIDHEPESPHPCDPPGCEACDPPPEFETLHGSPFQGGGGSGGGGGASGTWAT